MYINCIKNTIWFICLQGASIKRKKERKKDRERGGDAKNCYIGKSTILSTIASVFFS